jgi:hypothetical protein
MFGLFKKQPAGPADKPHAALREFFKACNVYCRPESDQAIIASVFNHGGLMVEKPDGAFIVRFSNATALDTGVRTALDCCEYEENFNYSDQKRSDWPAYQESGYKTIKRFEADFIRLLVKGVNEKNFFYEVTSPEFGNFGLHLTITVDASTGNHGDAIQYIVKSYLACKTAASS